MTNDTQKTTAPYEIIYTDKKGGERRFDLWTTEDIKHERACAEREIHDPKGYVASYEIVRKSR